MTPEQINELRRSIAGSPAEGMASVRYQFVKDTGIGAALIRWRSRSPYSHVDLVLPDGNLLGARDSKIGNIPAGVQIRPPNYKHFSQVLVAELPCTEAQAQAIYAAVRSQIGKPYATEAIWDFIVDDNSDPQPTADNKAWFCDQLQAWGALAGGVPMLNPKTNLNAITPGDLLLSLALIY